VAKNELGHVLDDFFTDTSGHPGGLCMLIGPCRSLAKQDEPIRRRKKCWREKVGRIRQKRFTFEGTQHNGTFSACVQTFLCVRVQNCEPRYKSLHIIAKLYIRVQNFISWDNILYRYLVQKLISWYKTCTKLDTLVQNLIPWYKTWYPGTKLVQNLIPWYKPWYPGTKRYAEIQILNPWYKTSFSNTILHSLEQNIISCYKTILPWYKTFFLGIKHSYPGTKFPTLTQNFLPSSVSEKSTRGQESKLR
jgi:hypothetical protein